MRSDVAGDGSGTLRVGRPDVRRPSSRSGRDRVGARPRHRAPRPGTTSERRRPNPGPRPTGRRGGGPGGPGRGARHVPGCESPEHRVMVLAAVLVVLVAAVAWRLVSVQLLDRDRYIEFGEQVRVSTKTIQGNRGTILDRDLNVLAVTDDRPTVWVNPQEVVDVASTAEGLASVLSISPETLRARMEEAAGAGREFMYIARQVSPERGRAAEALDLPGVHFAPEASRLRPNGRYFARGILGHLDPDGNPVSGLESGYDELLAGQDGTERVEVDVNRQVALPDGETVIDPARTGRDLVLTIQRETQFLAEQKLTEQVESTGAVGGTAVIIRTATGEVLAAASVRRDPDSGEVRPASYNMAFVDIYEPGSVGKAFTISGALEEGVVTPDTEFDVPDSYEFADKVFTEPFSGGKGLLTVSEVLANSSNIGTIMISERLGAERLYRYLRSFGFGSATGPDGTAAVPGESSGILPPLADWYGTELATIAFGQGIAVTPVQLAAAYNTIANDGVYVAPTLVRGTRDENGRVVPLAEPETHRVVSSETALEVRRMLQQVVLHGTGKLAAIPGYEVGGKTGTAQKASPDGGYSETDYMSTFAGFVPVENPELTIVVVLDSPQPYYAGAVAAPLFSDLGEYVLRALRVSPSDSIVTADQTGDPTVSDGSQQDAGGTGDTEGEAASGP